DDGCDIEPVGRGVEAAKPESPPVRRGEADAGDVRSESRSGDRCELLAAALYELGLQHRPFQPLGSSGCGYFDISRQVGEGLQAGDLPMLVEVLPRIPGLERVRGQAQGPAVLAVGPVDTPFSGGLGRRRSRSIWYRLS